MSLVCHLDDSGNEDDPIVTLAGYIAPAGDWLNFEVHARKLFDAHKLPYLHTMDLHQRKREFKGWTRKQTAQFANVFCRVLDQHTYAGFEFSVLKSTFEANKSVYKVERQSSPIGFCLHGIVHQLVNDEGVKAVLAPPDVNLSFVVESGNRNEGYSSSIQQYPEARPMSRTRFPWTQNWLNRRNEGELGSSTFSPGQVSPAGPLGLGAVDGDAQALRLLRGEPVELLSRQLGVEIFRLEQWREKAIAGIDASLKERKGDPVKAELPSGPLGRRRSRR